ncbi:hypothetical protein IFM89_008779 [Coptis chinensis]|uniref:eRF1 domain-containing protein n=1 Tax=Coptis chinensis TaxID=261450 RepID=A0A835GWU3_9MAGN|nr:hypothetical protein IFM89_008779 [Coptis chinensis]
MDGNGTLFGTLSGNTREVLHKFTVDLPKKYGRGGQSAKKFDRLLVEKRHNYVRKTAELARQLYINASTNQPNVLGLILAGSADFKTELSQSDIFDSRLQAKIRKVVDISCGGGKGFNQAIELSAEMLSTVKFVQEMPLIGKFFEETRQITGKYVSGIDNSLKALEMGETVIKHFNKEQEANQSNFHDSATSSDFEIQDKTSLLDWFANDFRKFGCSLEFVTNKSRSEFCRGFGGIGGILRYQEGREEACTGDAQSHSAALPQKKDRESFQSTTSLITPLAAIPREVSCNFRQIVAIECIPARAASHGIVSALA